MKRILVFTVLTFILIVSNAQVKVSAKDFSYSFDGEFVCAFTDGYDSTSVYLLINSDSIILHTVAMNRHTMEYRHIWRKAMSNKDLDHQLTWVNDEADSELYYLDVFSKLDGYNVNTLLIFLESIYTNNGKPLLGQEPSNIIRIACCTRDQAYSLLEKIK